VVRSPPAIGVEGLVAKGKASRYESGRRGWLKVRHRDTVEIIVAGVLGPIARPEVVIAGRYRGDELIQVGRSGAATSWRLSSASGLRPFLARPQCRS
jgi:ATP-dependent DNA ligase